MTLEVSIITPIFPWLLDKKLVLLITLSKKKQNSMCFCVFQNKMELPVKNSDSEVSTDSYMNRAVYHCMFFLTQIRPGCQKSNIYLHIFYIADHSWEP